MLEVLKNFKGVLRAESFRILLYTMRFPKQAHIIHAFRKQPDRREFWSFLRKNKNCRFLLSIKLPIGPSEDSSRQWEKGR